MAPLKKKQPASNTYDDHQNLIISTSYSSNNNVNYNKIGIYGWRKRCLYCLILAIVIILFINLSLTIWILVSINFNYNGLIGNLKFTQHGLKLNGQTVILDELVTAKIVSQSPQSLFDNTDLEQISNQKHRHHHEYSNLDILTDKSIRFYTKNNVNNQLKTSLFMNNHEIKLNCDNFTIVNSNNETLFSITNKTALINTHELKYHNNENSPLEFERLRTSEINSNEKLNILSNGKINISASSLSLNGSVLTINTQNNLTINAARRITFQAEEIKLVRLPIFPFYKNRNYDAVLGVYQLCLCENGLLYAQNATSMCSYDASICG